MTLAITGATGFLGKAVIDLVCRRRVQVKALTRRAQEPRSSVAWVHGDLANDAALAELVSGTRAVLHIAGVVNAPDRAGFQAGNVEGTRRLLDAARQEGVRRFICVSSLAAREPSLSDYGHSKREAEDLVTASPLQWTVVRPPAIYGPRDTEMLQLFKAARLGFMPMPPKGRASIIYSDDLAALLLTLVDETTAHTGCIYEPDDGRPRGWSHQELAAAIGKAVGKKVCAPALPKALLMMAAHLDRHLRGANAKLTPDRAAYLSHHDWVSAPDRIVPPAFWRPETETQKGLAATAQWYRDNDWL